ncbi:ribosome recycling factor [Corynebacterium sp. H127]|uniref:ribosome recycling factor n=1 Tax=Corynebacterium sp. H127 TaxID=3133418 RepID=UPI003096BDFB
MIDEILFESEERMNVSVEHTREDLTTIRTGRANPAMFNGIMAEYYGTLTPITQMATIAVPEPRMLLIKPYEMSVMNEIENAIRNSDLGVNPTNDGQVLRVTIPQLTEERRKDMVKLAKSKGEDGKIAIRNIRRKGMEQLKKLQKDGDAGEDEVVAAEKELDKVTQKYVAQMDDLVAAKEKELMEV